MQHLLCKVVNFLSALGAIYVGLLALNLDLMEKLGLQSVAHIGMYVFGIAGVLSMVMIFTCRDKC